MATNRYMIGLVFLVFVMSLPTNIRTDRAGYDSQLPSQGELEEVEAALP
jgi:hypothetical protein